MRIFAQDHSIYRLPKKGGSERSQPTHNPKACAPWGSVVSTIRYIHMVRRCWGFSAGKFTMANPQTYTPSTPSSLLDPEFWTWEDPGLSARSKLKQPGSSPLGTWDRPGFNPAQYPCPMPDQPTWVIYWERGIIVDFDFPTEVNGENLQHICSFSAT